MQDLPATIIYGLAKQGQLAITALLLVVLLILAVVQHRRIRSLLHDLPGKATSDVLCPPLIDLNAGGSGVSIYDARHNLRLGQSFGPILLLRQIGAPFGTRFLQKLLPKTALRLSFLNKPSDTILLINSAHHAKTLLERHGASYSSRVQSIAAGKLLSDGRRIVLLPYGPRWRLYHRALVQLLFKQKIEHKWRNALRHEALHLVSNLAELVVENSVSTSSSTDVGTAVLDQISRFTASSVLQIAYARRAPSTDDRILKNLAQVSSNIADAFTPAKYAVERYPFLACLPAWFAPWKRKLQQQHAWEAMVYCDLLADVERRLQAAKDTGATSANMQQASSVIREDECCAAELLESLADGKADHSGLDRKDIAYICATVFEAGSETTAMTLNTFLLAAALYPEVAERARCELEEAMGAAEVSVPGFGLMGAVPYVCAVVNEALRMTPAGSSGVAHASSRAVDDEVCFGPGMYVVPGRATVLPNIYGIHHDTAVWDDAWTFEPCRFLGGARALTHDHHAFGFGRRICPGRDLAANALFIAVCHLLWAFDIQLVRHHALPLARRIAATYTADARRFRHHFSPTAPNSPMDNLNLPACLLDAHTNHKLARHDLVASISLTLRHPTRRAQVEQSLAAFRDTLPA